MSFALFPSVFLCLNVVILLCVTGNGNSLVSSFERGEEGNASAKTSHILDLFLAPPFSIQHDHANSSGYIKNSSEILSDDPDPIIFVDLDELRKELKTAEDNFAKEKQEFEDKKSKLEKVRGDFESKKREDEMELAKMEDLGNERRSLEEKLLKLVEEEEGLKKSLDREEEELKEDEIKIAAEEKKYEELIIKTEILEKKKLEYAAISKAVEGLLKDLKERNGECYEVSPSLQANYDSDERLCSLKEL